MSLHLLVKVKAADLNYFDKEQNSVVRGLRTFNLNTALLMSFSAHIILTTRIKWMDDCEIIVEAIALDPETLSDKVDIGDSPYW